MPAQNSWRLLARSRPSSLASPSRNFGARFTSSTAETKPKRGVFTRVASALSTGVAFYTVGVFYPPQVVSFLFPRPAPPPLHPESAEGVAKTAEIESTLHALPHVALLRDSDDYYETRPYADYPEERRVHSLTSGSLRGPSKLAVPPLLFARHDESESIVFIHVGRSLCGHDGIIHGGLLATLLDETLARTAIMNLPGKIGVTANLAVNYRAPTKADQFVKITTKLERQKGRKAVVTGRIEDLEGTLLVDATATFVEPKYASMLKTSAVTAAIGKPTPKYVKVPVPQEASI